jgi:[acyl-carrier-protein] S-malonyltransferase
MQPVQERLGEVMADMTWTDARVPLAANVSGELVTRGEDIRQALIAQVASPVQWMACIQALLDAGCRRFVELGPGRVLSGLVRHISPRAETTAADSPAAIDALLG